MSNNNNNNRLRKELLHDVDLLIDKKIKEDKEKVAQEASKKKPLITEIAQKPWYIIITLIIALFGGFGGASGVYLLYSLATDKPSLKFHPKNFLIRAEPLQKTTLLLFSGIIENDGKKPLLIDGGFNLEMTLEDGTILYPTAAGVLPKDLEMSIDSLQATFSNINDLQTVYRLNSNDPISGYFLFYVDVPPLRFRNPKTLMKLYCYDTHKKMYLDSFYFTVNQITGEYLDPRNGLKVTPLSDTARNR
jgi:hypothetical protein